MTDEKVKKVHAKIANHCGEIAKLFKPGARISVLVRNSDNPENDMIVTDDSFEKIFRSLNYLSNRPEEKLSHQTLFFND